MTIDDNKLNSLLGKFVTDFGAALHAATVIIGEKLGLYNALASAGVPLAARELAEHTGTTERYVAEWLAAQAASGYIEYDGSTGKYSMTREQALVLADDSSPTYVPGAFLIAASVFKDEPTITAAFRTGKGVGWHEHHHDLFHGTAKFFRPGYAANLVANWLPALDGVVAKLEAGARVADIGCGHGITTVLMAKAFPRSTFIGFDYHAPSIEAAREEARRAGVADRVKFEVASAKDYPGTGYDLVAFFDCLHDMGDPVGAAAHVKKSLAPDGTWLLVEPFAHDKTEQNLNPVGRVYYSASTCICTPASCSQEVGLALGAQAGEGRLREVLLAGGFKSVRRATETPFNLVLEAKL
jgi:SAM-dependent methyltransferase